MVGDLCSHPADRLDHIRVLDVKVSGCEHILTCKPIIGKLNITHSITCNYVGVLIFAVLRLVFYSVPLPLVVCIITSTYRIQAHQYHLYSDLIPI